MIYLSKFVGSKRIAMIYTSTDFDKEQSATYTLLIRVASDENALAIVDKAGQLKWIATYHPSDTVKPVKEMLDLDFSAVKVAVRGSRYALIPDEVFDTEKLPAYLQHLPDDGLAATNVATVEALGVRLLHQTDRLETTSFTGRFPDLSVYPVMQVLLSGCADKGMQNGGPVLVLDKHGITLNMVFFDRGKLIYAGDFKVVEGNDLTYYLFSVLTHLDLENRTPSLLLSGDITEKDDIHQWASSTSNEVRFVDSSSFTGVTLPEELLAAQHRFFTLLGLHQCE